MTATTIPNISTIISTIIPISIIPTIIATTMPLTWLAVTISHDVMARLTCHLADCGLYMTKKDRHTIVAGLI